MIIFNAGVPRSGTVLVNAMIRVLLARAGARPAQANPHGRELPALVEQLLRQGHYLHRPVVVHTHSWDTETERMLAGNPHVVAFANYRDPRDVCVSLMRLHDLPYEDAQQVVTGYFGNFESVVRSLGAMVMPYELLVGAQEAHCFQIARRLGLWPTFEQVREVVEKTSMDRHRKVMEDVQSGKVKDLAERKNRRRVLREDRQTLINDRHIQSGASGRWRAEMTEDQQGAASEAFRPIIERYGYAG